LIAVLFIQFCQGVSVLGRFCLIVNLRLLLTVFKISGSIWMEGLSQRNQIVIFSAFAQKIAIEVKLMGDNKQQVLYVT